MSDNQSLKQLLDEIFPDLTCKDEFGELTLIVPSEQLKQVAGILKTNAQLLFKTLIDLCGVDYLTYGQGDWQTDRSTQTGFGRGRMHREYLDAKKREYPERFAVVIHLLSVKKNQRLRLKVYCPNQKPVVPSVVDVWPVANWYEREAFDLFGILFDGHPDLRRLLTDYGFVGHPFRKDFPLSGYTEVRYDKSEGRVVSEAVDIEPRTLVPRVIRDDHRYIDEQNEGSN